MGYSFKEIGMTRADILTALDAMPDQDVPLKNRSRKDYLIDPRDGVPWDLKSTLRVAATISRKTLYPKFTSDRYQPDLRKLGFSYLVFDQERRRILGVSGFDPEELADPHTVYHPDGQQTENGGSSQLAGTAEWRAVQQPSFKERMVARHHLAWERRGVNTRRIKEEKGLTCEGCRLDAEAAFGRDRAMSCIEAHHLKPVAEMPPEGRIVSPEDFAVLCATCHRLIHTLDSPDDLKGLRRLVKGVLTARPRT